MINMVANDNFQTYHFDGINIPWKRVSFQKALVIRPVQSTALKFSQSFFISHFCISLFQFLLLQTLCDCDDDSKAFVFIITIPTLAHILPAKCLPYIFYMYLLRYFIRLMPKIFLYFSLFHSLHKVGPHQLRTNQQGILKMPKNNRK